MFSSVYRWFCGVDDDNYLNVKQLLNLLQDYKHEQDVYLGRASLSHPIEAMDRENKMVQYNLYVFCHRAYTIGPRGYEFVTSTISKVSLLPYERLNAYVFVDWASSLKTLSYLHPYPP